VGDVENGSVVFQGDLWAGALRVHRSCSFHRRCSRLHALPRTARRGQLFPGFVLRHHVMQG
jgi:hypothetical protein